MGNYVSIFSFDLAKELDQGVLSTFFNFLGFCFHLKRKIIYHKNVNI